MGEIEKSCCRPLVPTLSNTETLELNLAYMLKVCLIVKPGHSVLVQATNFYQQFKISLLLYHLQTLLLELLIFIVSMNPAFGLHQQRWP